MSEIHEVNFMEMSELLPELWIAESMGSTAPDAHKIAFLKLRHPPVTGHAYLSPMLCSSRGGAVRQLPQSCADPDAKAGHCNYYTPGCRLMGK